MRSTISSGRNLIAAGCAATLIAVIAGSAWAADCANGSFPSTFALIQKAIFENKSCNTQVCHSAAGAASTGGLDLSPDVAYANLVDAPAQSVPGYVRVVPGRRDISLLFLNLAAATSPMQYHAPLRPMPLNLPPLSSDELEAMRRWIESGAPKDAVVAGTDLLLDACLPPPEPIAIEPLPPPPAGTGVQLHMPRWVLLPNSEREVCFVSYYDVTDQVPAEFRGPTGTTFRYKRNEIRQDPLSHHLIVSLYNGETPLSSPAWGPFTCKGGALDGQTCDPTSATGCADGSCGSEPTTSIACLGFGPADAGTGLRSFGFTGTQKAADEIDLPDGVYREIPLKGIIIWNSHAFNLTSESGKLEAWLNFEFAPPEDQKTPGLQIFDTSDIFKMSVPAFKTEEICQVHELQPNARLFELSSHGHKRMKRWRTFMGAFTCKGGPADGQACEPLGYDFVSPDTCAGAPCTSLARQHVGDCNVDDSVSIDELITAVNIALGSASMDACQEADTNGDLTVTVDELLKAVNAALNGVPPPVQRDPQASMTYVSLIYNDPITERFDPPLMLASPDPAERSVTFCALYDNGFTDPTTVKRKSTSPNTPLPIPGTGGPCKTPTNCTDGKVGAPCTGLTTAQRNASCDSASGAGDGMCDACPLLGGVTTEDEMFILLGQFYVP